MARLVRGDRDPLPEFVVEVELRECEIRPEVKLVVVPIGNHHSQARVLRHRRPQHLEKVHVRRRVPGSHIPRDRILQIGIVAQVDAKVLVYGGVEGASDGGRGGIELHELPSGIRVDPREPAVESAKSAVLISKQLLAEAVAVDPQVRALDVALRKTRISRQPLHHRSPLTLGQPVSAQQRLSEVSQSEGLDFVQDFSQSLLLQVRGDHFVVPGGGSEVRQLQGVLEDSKITILLAQGTRRDKDQPAQVHAVYALKIIGQARRAPASVALPEDVLRRLPAPAAGDVQTDKFRHRFDVLPETVELLGIHARLGSAKACRHRIDKHQVGNVEQRVLVVHKFIRRLWAGPIILEMNPSRSQQTQVQPDRRGTGSSVEHKQQRPLALVRKSIQVIRDIEDIGQRFALVIDQGKRSRGRRITQSLGVNIHHAPRDRGVLSHEMADGESDDQQAGKHRFHLDLWRS